jgi:uncharacterized protein YgbK (DUF1537 family)
MTRTLILSDDLSGAADCASACLNAGASPLVLIDRRADPGNAEALAVDVDSRALPPQEAGIAMAAAVAHFLRPDTRVFYQKMDSTLRGNWARETACALQAAASIRGQRPFGIVAPAFPAAGRTMSGGRVYLHGIALEETETWARERLTRPAEPGAWLDAEGLRVARAGLDDIRLGTRRLASLFADQGAEGADAVICDAETEGDLNAIAGAALALAPTPLCVGSAGLMRSLARMGEPRPSVPKPPVPVATTGPVLVLVGSASEVSRRQVRALIEERAITAITIPPSALRERTRSDALQTYGERVDAVLSSGADLVVAVDGSEGVDLEEGQQLSGALVGLMGPRLPRLGGLVVTGGETARAVLTRAGVSGLRIHGEVEAGVPLSSALGTIGIPVVTKAGAFGDPMTLIRCLDAIRGHSPGP